MIEAKNIWKSYGDLKVLKGIDLVIPEKKSSHYHRSQRRRKKHSIAYIRHVRPARPRRNPL